MVSQKRREDLHSIAHRMMPRRVEHELARRRTSERETTERDDQTGLASASASATCEQGAAVDKRTINEKVYLTTTATLPVVSAPDPATCDATCQTCRLVHRRRRWRYSVASSCTTLVHFTPTVRGVFPQSLLCDGPSSFRRVIIAIVVFCIDKQ